jgi:hypothetical protein
MRNGIFILIVAVFLALPAFAGEIAKSSAKPQQKKDDVQTTGWGAVSNGLQCKISAPQKIEHNMPLSVDVFFRPDMHVLPQGIKALNTYLLTERLTLYLTNTNTKRQSQIRISGPGMPTSDLGQNAATLNGAELGPYKATFYLVHLNDTLFPGIYECSVGFKFPKAQYAGWQDNSSPDWENAGFWHGSVMSPMFSIAILEETPKMHQFLVPERLRLEKGLQVMFRKTDAVQIDLPLRNGFWIGWKILLNGSKIMLGGFGPSEVNSIDCLSPRYEGGTIDNSYTLILFETVVQPAHEWNPDEGSGNYKELWKKAFRIVKTEEEMKELGWRPKK